MQSSHMRIAAHSEQILDLSSILGIVAGTAMLMPAFFVPELRLMAIPACAVLLPSLLCGTR
jgi:hypothetical protein